MKTGRPSKYTQEMLAFLKKNMKGKQWADITSLLNEAFNTSFTKTQIKNYCKKKRLNRSIGSGNAIFPLEIRTYMKDNYIEVGSFSKLTGLVNSKFGASYTYEQIKNWFYHQGLKLNLESGKGSIASVGSEYINSEGHVIIKVSMTGTHREMWKRKHHVVWEQAHGKIPKCKYIIFLDNNRQNCALENLALVDMAEQTCLIRYGLRFADPELTKTGLAIVKHGIAIKNRLKEKEG